MFGSGLGLEAETPTDPCRNSADVLLLLRRSRCVLSNGTWLSLIANPELLPETSSLTPLGEEPVSIIP